VVLQKADKKELSDKRQLTLIDTSEESNLKQRVYALFQQFPRISPKEACRMLNLSHAEKGHTIRTYLSGFRCQSNFGNIPSVPISLPHWRKWRWNPVVFTEEGRDKALSSGWRVSKNRNKMLVFRHGLGSVEWFQNGTVWLVLRGSSSLGNAKTLVCRAFCWLSDSDLSRLCEGSLREFSRQWVFETGSKLPRFEISQFQKSHGLRIFTDRSHPTSVEIEELEPLYLQMIIDQQNKFGENLRSHLDLVQSLNAESKKRVADYDNWRISHSPGSGGSLLRRFWAVMTTPL
jgi:hypothetical protein